MHTSDQPEPTCETRDEDEAVTISRAEHNGNSVGSGDSDALADIEFVMPGSGLAPNFAAHHAEEELAAWVDRTGLTTQANHLAVLRNARPERVAALLYPIAPPVELAIITQWLAVNFMVDDLLDAEDDPDLCAETIAELVGVLDHGAPTATNPVADAVAELWRRTRAGRSDEWCGVFRTDVAAWLETYAHEAADRARGRIPRIGEYRRHRRLSSGMLVFVDLVEAGLCVDLPSSVRRSDQLNTLRANTSEHMGLVNDMYSLDKELASGQIHNAVYLVMLHKGCGKHEALREVNDMATECLREYENAARSLRASEYAEPHFDHLSSCLNGYKMLMRGAFDCYAGIDRYSKSMPNSTSGGGLL